MKKVGLLILILVGGLLLSGMLFTALAQDNTQTIVITVRTNATPPMENWRGNNFILAAKELNADLEAAGDPRRVEVKIVQDHANWSDYKKEFVLSYGAGKSPDIWLSGHEDVATQAAAGRIIALDDLLKEFPKFNNVIDALWQSCTYKGNIWAVPQDTEARPLYWNKSLLKQLGWSDEKIAGLPEAIKNGEFTLDDMLATAKEAVDKGIVPDGNGFWTRPKNGGDFTAFYYDFGGQTIDPTTGKLVFDKAAGLKYYKFFYDAAQKYGSMKCLGLGWSEAWHPTITSGKVLFWLGGTWQWAEWGTVYLKDKGGEDYEWENFGFGLIPAAEKGGKPVTLSHPLVYMISSQCKYPDLALALIAKVTDYGPNTRHALSSTHLGILKGQTNYIFYKKSRLLSDTLYMLDYTTFLPNNPYWGSYSTITYNALAAVVSGDLTPEKAVDFVVDQLTNELGDKVIIR
ncbi:ABC transporter substrate-binding protein [Candidatus Acetothermia bacterium]|nr:MAG: ABC transporter substrate-binding protein [Candidatus Acetothermia bacterium]